MNQSLAGEIQKSLLSVLCLWLHMMIPILCPIIQNGQEGTYLQSWPSRKIYHFGVPHILSRITIPSNQFH
ncbi:hypothetical protein K435DRAFT_778111 [Dendrothele bispora CBS 962.96]|uniref:Uncharacterized protein n=1 Tax=Dendrothele bispora (strain CBS 962.96) TaxID=1314807 RepID=A0A4S8M509_DENBC|nr:hypothetical protein K435DRAFT_778111 [Dendrothele bispora CBS 962.96]